MGLLRHRLEFFITSHQGQILEWTFCFSPSHLTHIMVLLGQYPLQDFSSKLWNDAHESECHFFLFDIVGMIKYFNDVWVCLPLSWLPISFASKISHFPLSQPWSWRNQQAINCWKFCIRVRKSGSKRWLMTLWRYNVYWVSPSLIIIWLLLYVDRRTFIVNAQWWLTLMMSFLHIFVSPFQNVGSKYWSHLAVEVSSKLGVGYCMTLKTFLFSWPLIRSSLSTL